MDISRLRGAGLTDGEAAIYVGLLKLGPTPVSRLSEITGLHRTNIYDILEKLKEKGLVSFYIENGRKFFQAASPERLLSYLDEKKELLGKILPELKNLRDTAMPSSDVQIFKGRQALKFFFEDVIENLKIHGGNAQFFGVDENMWLDASELQLKRYWQAMEQNGFFERVLVKQGAKQIGPKRVTEYKEIPAQYFEPIPTVVYGNVVSIFIWEPVRMMIRIENKEIAQSYRKYFDYLWNLQSVTLTGQDCAIQIYNDIYNTLKSGDEALVFGISSASDIHYNFFEEWEKKVIKKGIKVRGIFSDTDTDQVEQATRNGFDIRVIPKSYANPVEVNVFGNKVAMVIFAGEHTSAHVIDNPIVAKSFRHFFEVQWKSAKTVK